MKNVSIPKKLVALLCICIVIHYALTGCNTQNPNIKKLLTIANGHASQGTAIYEDTLFICNKYGHCYMYRLPAGEVIADFPLGSYNNSDTPKQNHCNQIMFGPKKFDDSDSFPLLYITTSYSDDHDVSGAYYAKCSVERILYEEKKGWYAEIVQTVEFNDKKNIPDADIDGTLTKMYQDGRFLYISGNGYDASLGYEKIGYGWPHFYVDSAPTAVTSGKLYIFSARFRGSKSWEEKNHQKYDFEDYTSDNNYIFTEFVLPALPASENDSAYGDTVTLYPKDITDQFSTEFDIYTFQGGTMYNGKIYHAFGYGNLNDEHRNGIRVFDIAKREITAKLDLSGTEMTYWEPECCCIYNGELALSAYNMNKLNKLVNLYILDGVLEK